LKEGRPLILGGVEIPFAKGLVGHSDADVLVHAICDALLGAASLGDIGTHFPPSDEKYRGVSSLRLLAQTVTLLEKEGYRINNIDATLVAQTPRLNPFFDRMRETLVPILKISPRQLSLKAKTAEGLGSIGQNQGIMAFAVALLSREVEAEEG